MGSVSIYETGQMTNDYREAVIDSDPISLRGLKAVVVAGRDEVEGADIPWGYARQKRSYHCPRRGVRLYSVPDAAC